MTSNKKSYYLSTILEVKKSQLLLTARTRSHRNLLVCGFVREHVSIAPVGDIGQTIEKYCRQSKIGCVLGHDAFSFECVHRHLHHIARQCMTIADAACHTTAYIDAFCKVQPLLYMRHLKDTNLKVQSTYGQKLSSTLTDIFGTGRDELIAFVPACFDFEIFAPSIYGRVVDIQCGDGHILFLTDAGNVFSCGENHAGQCGVAHASYVSSPTQMDFDCARIRCVAAGKLHSLFVDDSGKLWTCGYNFCGQLGLKAVVEASQFVTTEDPADITATLISCVDVAPNNDLGVFEMIDCDDESDLESETDSKHAQLEMCTPTVNNFFAELRILFARCGSFHSLVITEQGEAYTFGHNGYGNLGNNEVCEWGTGNPQPHRVAIPGKIINGACGWNHNVLLTEDNEIFTFGDNANKQCSKTSQKNVIKIPTKLSKYDEFRVHENYFVDFVMASNQHTLIICDPYKRA